MAVRLARAVTGVLLVCLTGAASPLLAQQRIGVIQVGQLPDSIAVNPATERVYVANGLSNTISVIDGATHVVLATIPVVRAGQLAVNPVTNRIYVAALHSGTLSVIDGASHAVTTVPLPSSECPCGVAVNAVTNRVYVTRPRTGELFVLDGATNAVVATIAIGLDPHHVVVNEATNKAYVLQNPGFAGAGIVVIDGASNLKIGSIPVLAEDLTLDPATSLIYAVRDFPRFLHVVDATADALVQSIALSDFFGNVAVNSRTQRLYLNGNDNMGIYDAATRTKVGALTGLLAPGGLRFTKTLASLDDRAKVFKVNRGGNPTEAGANTVEVIQDVGALNEPPVAHPADLTTDEDVPLSGTLSATDPDGDTLTYALVTNGTLGVATVDPSTGAFSYTPHPDVSGVDTFTFKVNDGSEDSEAAAVTVTIAPVNDAPVAADDGAVTDEEAAVGGNALSNDRDIDGGPLSARLVTGAAHGAVVLTADGAFTYTPARGFNGTDSFTYVASDGLADSSAATAFITVNPVNDPPIAHHDFIRTTRNTPVSALLRATDVDGDALEFSVVVMPSRGTLTLDARTGAVVYQPNKNFFGLDLFAFRARDASVESNVAWVVVSVEK